MTLGSGEARHPHEVVTRRRQSAGVSETGRPRTAGGEDGAGPWGREGQEPVSLGPWRDQPCPCQGCSPGRLMSDFSKIVR